MELIIQKGNKTLSLHVSKTAAVKDLKLQYQQKYQTSVYRQSFKLKLETKLINLDDDEKSLSSYGVTDGSILAFKDFGPQIGYRTVFIAEYLGPLVFVLLYSLRPSFIYGKEAVDQPFHPNAYLGVLCWTVHFLKRELETIFVHRFSRPTMPLFNLFKNCSYYWFFGLAVGYPLCHPLYTSPASSVQVTIGLSIFVIAEVLNLLTHIQLRNMRPAEGSKVRPIPKGVLFSLVACPNYTFEVLGWVGFSIMTQVFIAYVFTIIGFLQMTDWALKKHRGYSRTWGDDYKKLRRKAIIPFIL